LNHNLKIGILGGSFDPIHNGHLIIAQTIAQSLKLDRIILIPANQQPLKQMHHVSAADRLKMVGLAIADNPLFSLCDYEVTRGGSSFTVDTLKFLHKQYPESEFYLIIGADSLQHLNQWRQADEIVSLCKIVVATRSQYDISADANAYSAQLINTPIIEISSTIIREMVAKNYDIIYLVPPAVKDYILSNKLYNSTDV